MLRREPEQLQNQRFDLLIIGGGISGAALAWDASLRGLKVALVEKSDFGGATSAATSKLIHGGLRYLKNVRLGLVRESLRERRILQEIAGHLVRPLPFFIPTYRRGNRKSVMRLGLTLYDLLAYDRKRVCDPEQRLPGHQVFGRVDALEMEPVINAEGLTGGVLYYDCQCEPERLTLTFLQGAAEMGARLLNYTRVREFLYRLGRVDAVEAEDLIGGRRFEISARIIVNVTGPWVDELDRLCGAGEEAELRRSKGIHLVTRPLTMRHALVLRTSDGRHMFVIPWRGHSLIGTTDTPFEGELDRLAVEEAEEAALLEEVNRLLPQAHLSPAAVKYRYAGVRPIVDSESSTYQASRRYEILDHHRQGKKGLISATGGKYTTSRSLAEKLTDRILAYLGEPKVSCRTASTRLPGAVGGAFTDYLKASLERARGSLPEKSLELLVRTYGSRHEEVLELIKHRPELAEAAVPGRPEVMAQVAFAIEEEAACTLADVLFRRTAIGCFGDPGDEVLEKLARFVGQRLGWGPDRQRFEIEICRQKMRGGPEQLAATQSSMPREGSR